MNRVYCLKDFWTSRSKFSSLGKHFFLACLLVLRLRATCFL